MTQTTTIPESLKAGMQRLEAAKAAHLENARKIDETETAINRAREQKAELEQENGEDTNSWRNLFRAGGAVLTDDLKKRHIERVAQRELAQECDNLAQVLEFEREKLKGSCDSSAKAYRQAHLSVLRDYAEGELKQALETACGALVRAMKLKGLVLDNPLANNTGHQGYVEPDKAVMHQVTLFLEQKISGYNLRLTDEPVLYKTGLSSLTLPHMDHNVAGTPFANKAFYDRMQQLEAQLKAKGLLS